ncbi:MAG: hypothetical protein ACJAWV_004498 [Flammeovirgaceae bacterium]|jgi:hypothetical protein
MLDISKKRDLNSGVDGDSQNTMPKVGVKAVQRLAGPADSADGRTTAVHFCLALYKKLFSSLNVQSHNPQTYHLLPK